VHGRGREKVQQADSNEREKKDSRTNGAPKGDVGKREWKNKKQ